MATKVKLIADGVITPDQITLTTASTGTNTTAPATTAFVQQEISALVDSSPEALNTLNELAAALGDDANFSTTVTNSIATKLPLAGGTLTGDLNFGDNDKAVFGAGSDLQIYSDGTNSIIKEQTVGGQLIVQGANINFQNSGGTESYAVFTENGAVTLYHNNSPKLATTSTGIDVTGTAVTDGLTVENTAGATLNINTNLAGADSKILLHEGTTASPVNGASIRYDGANNLFKIGVGSSVDTTRLTIARDTGNVGIGANNPGSILDIRETNSGGVGPTLSLINGASVADGNAVDINMAGNPGGGALAPTGRIRLTENASAIPTLGFHLYDGSTLGERMNLHHYGSTTLKLSSYVSITRLASGAGAVFGHNVEGSNNANEIIQSNTGYYGSFIKMYYNKGIAFHTMSSSGTAGDVIDSPTVSGTERMKIDSTGKTIIKTSGSSDDIRFFVETQNSSDTGIAFGRNGTNNLKTSIRSASAGSSSATFMKLALGESEGTISNSSPQFTFYYNGNLTATGSVSSDRRLKENIVDIPDGSTALIKGLNPVSFNLIGSPVHKAGFIAQEVEIVKSSLVNGGEEDEEGNETIRGVDYYGILAHAVKAIQEQQTIIEDLQARIETLEG